jgi:hypothetical protein
MTTMNGAIPKSLVRILTRLTNQSRIDLALTVAVRDLVRLRIKEVEDERKCFERKYGMRFVEFKAKWLADEIPDRYSYEVERDYWDWEGAVTDEASLREVGEHVL